MMPVLPAALWLQAFGFALAFLAVFAVTAHAVEWLWPRCRAAWLLMDEIGNTLRALLERIEERALGGRRGWRR